VFRALKAILIVVEATIHENLDLYAVTANFDCARFRDGPVIVAGRARHDRRSADSAGYPRLRTSSHAA